MGLFGKKKDKKEAHQGCCEMEIVEEEEAPKKGCCDMEIVELDEDEEGQPDAQEA